MLSMFWTQKKKDLNRKTIDVNINDNNIIWLLNEELKRMHSLLRDTALGKTGLKTDNNMITFWTKIDSMQQALLKLAEKVPDMDTQKVIKEIQDHLIEEEILDKDDGQTQP